MGHGKNFPVIVAFEDGGSNPNPRKAGSLQKLKKAKEQIVHGAGFPFNLLTLWFELGETHAADLRTIKKILKKKKLTKFVMILLEEYLKTKMVREESELH